MGRQDNSIDCENGENSGNLEMLYCGCGFCLSTPNTQPPLLQYSTILLLVDPPRVVFIAVGVGFLSMAFFFLLLD